MVLHLPDSIHAHTRYRFCSLFLSEDNFINIDFKYISIGGINVCSFIVYPLTNVSVHFRGINASKCDVVIFETMSLSAMRSYWKE